MGIKVTTSGVIGLEKLNANIYNLVSFRDFVEGLDVYVARVQGRIVESVPSVHYILLNPEYPIEDLKLPLGDSKLFRDDRLAAQTMARVWSKAPEGYDLVIHGKENGLAFVPMRVEIREQMRRETELLSIFVNVANSYRVSMPGGSSITVFNHLM
jgi:hypothetical protein